LTGVQIPKFVYVGDVAAWLGLAASELEWFCDGRHLERCDQVEPLRHYRRRWIRKRGGAARLIESPKPRLKQIQRRILREILDPLPPHPAAHGFRRGRNIVSFASPHVAQELLIRLDLSDFFPSIRTARISGVFRTLGYSQPVAHCLAALCTTWTPAQVFATFPGDDPTKRMAAEHLYRQPHLPQGAPTSPALANLCAWRLDARLSGFASVAGVNYTRYADDLLFSGERRSWRTVRRFLAQVGAIALDEGFQVNFRKTCVMRSSVRQRAAGIVVNHHINIVRSDFDRLKAILHNCVRRGPASQNRDGRGDFRSHLAGRVAFVTMVNPARGAKLQRLFDRIVWE
jgi:hypothetical protein